MVEKPIELYAEAVAGVLAEAPKRECARAELHAALTYNGRLSDAEADEVIARALAAGFVVEHPKKPGFLQASGGLPPHARAA